jgi:lipopolysaccharide transport system permease protein
MRRLLDPAANSNALRMLLRSFAQYRELLWEMTRRDIAERQAGLAFARFWVFGQPLLMMLVYIFVFSFIFKVRLGVGDRGLDYSAFLLAGLVPWLAFQEAVSRAPTCITENRSLIKQIVFPVEILPLKIVLSTLVLLFVGLSFPLILSVLAGTAHPLSLLLLPVPVLCQITLAMGLVYMIAAVGVFVRDIRNIIQLALMLGLYLQPILYAPGMLPPWTDIAFQISPFTHIVWLYRDAILGGYAHPFSWIFAPVLSIGFLAIGFRIFRSLRHAFGDAL